jgi:FixJ family two-component response regulator
MVDEVTPALVHVVDDDADLGASVARLLGRHGLDASSFQWPEAMLEEARRSPAHCVVTDVMMGEMDGFALAEQLRQSHPATAIIFMTAWPTTANAVDAIRRYGGLDYLEKPIDEDRLIKAVTEGVLWSRRCRVAHARLRALTPREREVLHLLAAGMSNKLIAAKLALSPKTIETHRAAVIAKTGAAGTAGLVALVRDANIQ